MNEYIIRLKSAKIDVQEEIVRKTDYICEFIHQNLCLVVVRIVGCNLCTFMDLRNKTYVLFRIFCCFSDIVYLIAKIDSC